MDIISSKYFEKFLDEQKISGGTTTSNFEKFINYIIFSTKNIANFELTSISIGGGNDAAIDGLAISLNNRFIQNMTELDTLLNTGMEFSVEFYFVQSKTTNSFDSKEILNFGTGVADVFKEEDDLKKIMSPSLGEKYRMIRKIIDNYEYTKDRKCYLYYVTTGKYIADDNLESAKRTVKSNIEVLGLFNGDDIELHTLGNDYVRTQYELTKVQNSATFKLDSKIDLPFIPSVQESYFAVMPIKEYLNIVIDNDDKIRRGIFELNIRDFAGLEDNRVNQDIESTISSGGKNNFGLLNNGITIVGKSFTKGQGKYTIKNFYIVNGCQTTNVLFKNRNKIDETMWISVKIVITDNDAIIKDIVKATNNQTEVEEIQLISMDEYQEKLESYFENFTDFHQLYYERRDGQYRGNPKVSPIDIITLEKQVKSFGATFLGEPHNSSRFIGKLYEDIDKKIFLPDHNPIIYYTSALIHHKIEEYFLNDRIESQYLKFQYHIQLILFKKITENEKFPQFNSKKMDEFCNKIIRSILDDNNLANLINFSTQTIKNTIKNLNDTEANKTQSTVNSLLRYIETGFTEETLKDTRYFLSLIDYYLTPFDNMKEDGDLRFNFNNRYDELKNFIQKYKMDDFISLEINLSERNITERESRKIISEEIYTIVSNKIKELKKIIEKTRKYA